jgi:hypothetical protein
MDQEESVPHLSRILGSGVPPEAMAFYGRWWQLEDWLREVVYVELRAKYGVGWTNHLQGHAPKRVAGDEANAYMASADAGELLAYADVSDLFRLIEGQWELFAPLLPPKRRWEGTSDELQELRNRNAHCRRPHRDDLARIEQTLRDLEEGAWRFYSSYLDTRAMHKSRDPVVRAWVGRNHETAVRLLDHADRQYDVRFRLGYSVRPWAAAPDENAISGSEGVLWHARWIVGGRDLNVAELWTEVARCAPVRELLVHLLVDMGSVTATFAAVDDPAKIADAIGDVFDDILTTSRPSTPHVPVEPEDWARLWTRGAEHLPRRVQVNSALTLVDPLEQGVFSIFGADP